MNKAICHFLSGPSGAKLELRILLRQTAEAFGVKAPKTGGFSAPELLECYAAFTADAARNAMESGEDLPALRRRLYVMARRLGSRLRLLLRPKNEQECRAVIRMLYRNLGITIREEKPGKFCVPKCYFSAFYTPEICVIIEALDRGIFAGVYGGGRLCFRERITEGRKECLADFSAGQSRPEAGRERR